MTRSSHENDLRNRKGDFAMLNKERRAKFMQGLSAVMGDADLTIVAIVIDKKRHSQKYTTLPPIPLGPSAWDRTDLQLERPKPTQKGHPCGFRRAWQKRGSRTEPEFRRVLAGQNRAQALLPFDIVMANKKSNSTGLQLADMTARPVGLSVLRPNQKNQAMDVIKTKLYAGRADCVLGNGLKVFP